VVRAVRDRAREGMRTRPDEAARRVRSGSLKTRVALENCASARDATLRERASGNEFQEQKTNTMKGLILAQNER
jgi:hypothetical protein